MIPKIIHYCWFGRKPIPENLITCMNSWKLIMPDYEWKCWDEDAFDVETISWTAEAYKARKYAFVSDYVRLFALYNYGGIYFDTDIKLLKSLAPLVLHYNNIMGFESENKLTSAVIVAEPHNHIIKEFLDTYDKNTFSSDIVTGNQANVIMMTEIMKKHGLRDDNTEQDVEQIHIFPSTYFCPLDFWHNKNFSEKTMAIHYFDASWLNDETKKRIEKERGHLYKLKLSIYQIFSKIKKIHLL